MNQDYTEITLPDHQPLATVGDTMSLDEQAARERTLQTVVHTILKEADHLMEHEGARAYTHAITQAWGYTNTMMERREPPSHGRINGPYTDLLDTCYIAQDIIAAKEEEYLHLTEQIPHEEPTEEEESEGTTHGAAVALLGAYAALREHVRGIARGDEMSTGHVQAALGLKITIEQHMETILVQHNLHCHHCDTTDKASEAAEATQSLMDAMRPAIRELTQIQLHPSLHQEPETQDQARNLAESTIHQLGSFQLAVNGDPVNPEMSLHCFYQDGTLHVKRLSDPFPKGMTPQGAVRIISSTSELITAHAQDHAMGFGDLMAEHTSEMTRQAECELHTATTGEINHYLETLARITQHPAAQADAVTALTGNRKLAQQFMTRRPDLFPPATPEQRATVMDTVRAAMLPPEMEYLINQLLSIGPAALNHRPEPPPIAQTAHLMEVANALVQNELTLVDIAESLGRSPHRDYITREWIDDFEEDRI